MRSRKAWLFPLGVLLALSSITYVIGKSRSGSTDACCARHGRQTMNFPIDKNAAPPLDDRQIALGRAADCPYLARQADPQKTPQHLR